MRDFVISCICLLNYGDLSNVDVSHYTISKHHSLLTSPVSLEKFFKYWEAISLMVEDLWFSKILIFV